MSEKQRILVSFLIRLLLSSQGPILMAVSYSHIPHSDPITLEGRASMHSINNMSLTETRNRIEHKWWLSLDNRIKGDLLDS